MPTDWICPACGRADATTIGPGAICPHDGRVLLVAERAANADADPMLGRVIGGQYAVYDQLGRGGMGAVYRAMHLRLRRHVALKTILPDRVDEDVTELKARFEQEALMLSELRHPGIVTVYDFGEEGDVLYMVLELIEGVSLADVLRRTNRLPQARAIDITRQLVEALGEPHRRGLTHRDIKPSNIMLEPREDGSERVVLIDFGVAKAKAGVMPEYGPTPRTQTGVAVGTPRYMAPEQLAGGDLGPWTDHYAVGVVLYRMLVGKSPFVGSPAEMIAAHLRDPVPPLPVELGLASLDPVIQRTMAKKPADRYPDGAALIAGLDVSAAVMSGAFDGLDMSQRTLPMAAVTEAGLQAMVTRHNDLPHMAPEPTPSDFSSGWRGAIDGTGIQAVDGSAFGSTRRRRWILATVILVLLGMGIGALVALRDDGPPTMATAQPNAAEQAPAAVVPSTPVPEAPAVAPEAAPAPDAGPVDAATPTPPTPAPAAAQTPRKATPKPTARKKRPARKGLTPAQMGRNVRRMIDACRCGDAERALKRLKSIDRGEAAALDDAYTTACGLIGVGCLAKGGAGGR